MLRRGYDRHRSLIRGTRRRQGHGGEGESRKNMYSAKRTGLVFSKISMYPLEHEFVRTFLFRFAIRFVWDERAVPDAVFSLARVGVITIMVLSGHSFHCQKIGRAH